MVESEGSTGYDYLGSCSNYVHLNPARAGMLEIAKGRGFLDFAWSSLSGGALEASALVGDSEGVRVQRMRDTVAGRRAMIGRLEKRMREEEPSRCGWSERERQTPKRTLKRGWYWGSANFRGKLLGLFERRNGGVGNRNYRSSEQKKAHGEAEAQRLLEWGMEALGLSERDIRRPVAVANVLDSRTTVSQKWIAQRLNMKSAANVSQQVRRFLELPGNHLPAPNMDEKF